MSYNSYNHTNLCKCKQSSVNQTLDELDFERGIWQAALNGDVIKVEKLLEKGCVDQQDNTGYTALHYASRNGDMEICKLLIKNNANVNLQTNGGCTALHRAAMMGHLNVIKLLVENECNLLIQDNDGRTALHRAALSLNTDCYRYLLHLNENLKLLKDNKGATPADLVPEESMLLKRNLS